MIHLALSSAPGHRFDMQCRPGCGACCIAPSISSPIPGMLQGKPAGVRCVQLTDASECLLFGKPERPAVCLSLKPRAEMCGDNAADAMRHLTLLERLTAPENDFSDYQGK